MSSTTSAGSTATTYGALRDGESDFILSHAAHGVLVVELKGGFITFEGRRQQWINRPSGGQSRHQEPLRAGQGRQAHALGKLREQPELADKWVGLQHAVAVPTARSITAAFTRRRI